MPGECVKVPRSLGETALRTLSRTGLYDRRRKARASGGHVLIPVVDSRRALEALAEEGVEAEECREELPSRKGMVDLGELRKKAEKLGLWRHSYHQVGDIIVFNARDQSELEALSKLALEYLKLLPHIKSVYAKLETVGEERRARLVHLAGERRTRTVVKEHGVLLAVDLAKAYYNPRLAEEHHRIAEEAGDGEVVVDMFAGVGGFCLHIAVLRKAMVICNDANPHAVELAFESTLLNMGRIRGWVHITNMDARDLPYALRRVKADRVIMNHPTASWDFLDTALTIVRVGAMIHLYTLAPRGAEPATLIPPSHAGRLEAVGWREVLEHSPSKTILRLDLRVHEPSQQR